jgi:predicted CXXCH cytochrome family protein
MGAFEWLLVATAMAVAGKALGVRERYWPWLLASLVLVAGAAALATTSRRSARPPNPIARSAGDFATSSACRSCHPAEYASFYGSFHRTMTQLATAETTAAPALRRGGRLHVVSNGRSVELYGRGTELWARMPDPGVTSAAPPEAYESSFRVAPIRDVRVELLTGSHHQQAFWVAGARKGELRAVPAVYLIDEARLVPRRDAFLNPPDAPEHNVRWNSNCIQCHAVAGAPHHDATQQTFSSSAAELGIACEACHGAGAEHVRAMQNPVTRYLAHEQARSSRDPMPLIVNPTKLHGERGSQVCGRCHSYFFPKQEADWWQHGFSKSYAPGGDLSQAQSLLSPGLLALPEAPELEASVDSLFYRDGTIRVGGREYNGLVLSPCYQRGNGKAKLGCFSCHSMHESEPDDQLRQGMRDTNTACVDCHGEIARSVAEHSHHAPSSPGSLCYNCHMPHTSYALLGAIRSHRIDLPSFDHRTRDRPNACSLCHLERSERWAAERAASWYGAKPAFELQRPAELKDAELPAGAVFALAGDAAMRVIAAAALGRRESDQVDHALRGQLLSELETDQYAAVRNVARRARPAGTTDRAGRTLPVELVSRLKALRDQRPITIAE